MSKTETHVCSQENRLEAVEGLLGAFKDDVAGKLDKITELLVNMAKLNERVDTLESCHRDHEVRLRTQEALNQHNVTVVKVAEKFSWAIVMGLFGVLWYHLKH